MSLSCVSKRDALQVVVPTQFVLFNLSAITGSAILYGDFKTAKFHQFVTFIYGCTATFAGVWIIAWVPASEGPSAGPDDRVGATSDVETTAHDVFVPDGISVGVVGRKPGNVPVLSRQSTVSLVGISPAQVQFSIYWFKEPITLICFYSAYYWYTRHLGLRFSSDKNMKQNLMDMGVKGAWEGAVPSPGSLMEAPHRVPGRD